MTKKIDCRTLECPAPVLKTKEFLEQEAATEIDVLVDNDAAVENVTRIGQKRCWSKKNTSHCQAR